MSNNFNFQNGQNGQNENMFNNRLNLSELIQRNSFLEFLLKTIKEKIDLLKGNNDELEKKIKKCSICLDKESNYIFIPCGHHCICTDCKNNWINFNVNNNNNNNNNLLMCPMCRNIGNIYKVY